MKKIEMTKIKFCGMSSGQEIAYANEVMPDYIGFVFAKQSRRYISPEKAANLKAGLLPQIKAVGVFVRENPENVAALLNQGVIDMAQLHGGEEEAYIKTLRNLTKKPVMQAFLIKTQADLEKAKKSSADMILLDAGAGDGRVFDWKLIQELERPYFLAGGLHADNVAEGIRLLRPYGVDVSSGIETEGRKEKEKMAEFMNAVRKAESNYDKC